MYRLLTSPRLRRPAREQEKGETVSEFWAGFIVAWCALNMICNVAIVCWIWHLEQEKL